MCPLCHSKKVRLSHRQPLDFFARLLQAQPMRCRNCAHRYYRWPWRGPAPSIEVTPPKVEARAAAAAANSRKS